MTILLPPWPLSRVFAASQSSPTTFIEPCTTLPATLDYYANPGVPPPSSRVDPKLKLQPRRPIRLWDVWKYGVVVASKATEVTSDVLSHSIWGPRKKSWGIEMTIVTSLMRGAGRHSSLVDIGTIRMLMSIGGLVPLPSDALVTPVTFRVKKRKLRGILADFDVAETGTRELSGEWVVGKKTWQRLQAEWKAAHRSQPVKDPFEPTRLPLKTKERVILYIHGGAYYLSSAAAQRLITIPLSKYTDARVFALDYRLAPETRFPGPLHDAVSAYLRLTDDLHIPPENIIVSGDSAGGGLSLALLMYLRDNAYPLPSGAILMSPWVDLTMSCESWDSNATFDVVPLPTADNHMNPIALYLGEFTEKYLTHPYASPLFGDFIGLPPLLIQAGDAEVLRDEISLLAHKATLAGVEVRHELYEDAIHVFQAYPFLSATRQSFLSMRDFVYNVLPRRHGCSPQLLGPSAENKLEREIENEKATVVTGAGLAIQSGMEGVKEKFAEERAGSSDSDEDHLPSVPSWHRSRKNWTLSSASITSQDDEEEEGGDGDDRETIERTTPIAIPGPTRTRPRSKTINGLRRIRSAISLIIPSHPPGTRKSMQANRASPFDPRHRQPASTLSMSSAHSPPPSPSVRRLWNASHPDISLLVEDWAHAGPANKTLLYKTHSYS